MKKQVKVVEKPLTTLFLEKDKRSEIGNLLKRTKELYLSYDKDSAKRHRLRLLSLDMWNSMQNEFYMTADISINIATPKITRNARTPRRNTETQEQNCEELKAPPPILAKLTICSRA